jgi:hypothetical protein
MGAPPQLTRVLVTVTTERAPLSELTSLLKKRIIWRPPFPAPGRSRHKPRRGAHRPNGAHWHWHAPAGGPSGPQCPCPGSTPP